MGKEDLDDEIEAINAIYPDSLVKLGSLFQLLIPDRDIILQISFSSVYPEEEPLHIISVTSKTYSAQSLNKDVLGDLLASVYVPGCVCLFEFIELIREVFEAPADEEEETENETAGSEESYEMTKADIAQTISAHWHTAAPIIDRKSTFIGFAVKADTAEEFFAMLAVLKADKHIARATHNMTAYRIRNANGTVMQDCDDDGESAAGSRLLHLLALSNLLGTVYTQGNLVFSPSGTSILSPVGNRVSCYDLTSNKSFTFPYEHRKNIACIALNPQSTLLLSVDVDGRAILVNFVRRTVLFYFNFKDAVSDLKFSPDGKYFAVAAGRHVQVWRTPEQRDDKQFAPFIRHRVYAGHFADVTSITWSDDSRFFLASSKDLTTKVYSLKSEDSIAAATLVGHREAVVASFFSEDQETIYTVSKDGALFQWKYLKASELVEEGQEDEEIDEDEDDSYWRIIEKNFFNQDAKVSCCTFHPKSNLLVVGFSSGIFGLYELPSFTNIQVLSISQNAIDHVTINATGEWLAFGASKLGQLLVWEWQSESYVIKQQGHFDSLNDAVYSPDGSKIVTAADDGKIKVWDAYSGFCIVTFTEHTSGVTALQFAKRGNVLFSASLDGSVRAWDLVRYRNFRTFTAASRVQFSSLAVDPSGEVVCAGSLDDFDIHLWSVQTAQLLDRLQGHEGPVSSLSFGSEGGLLASASWDKTVRIWSIFGRNTQVEPMQMQSDVLSIAMRPDSKQVAVSTLDGTITFWDVAKGKEVGQVDGKEDLAGGRHSTDRFSAKNATRSKYFTTICYSADGSVVLAGGNSKFICLYDIDNEVLLRKYTISRNMAIEGTLDLLNSKNMTEAGPLDLIDTTGEASDLEDRIDNTLPGANRGSVDARKVRPQIRTASINFSPTGQSFSAASTEGLLIYSQDSSFLFDPLDLDIDVTVGTTLETLKEKQYLTALIMSFRLNEKGLIQQVYESIPIGDIELLSNEFPEVYLERFFKFLTSIIDDSPHIEYHLLWIQSLITAHGPFMLQRRHEFASVLRSIAKYVTKVNKDINRLASNNVYYVQFLLGKQSKIESSARSSDAMDGIELVPVKENGTEDVEMDDADDDEEGWFGPEDEEDSKTQMLSKSSPAVDDSSDDEM